MAASLTRLSKFLLFALLFCKFGIKDSFSWKKGDLDSEAPETKIISSCSAEVKGGVDVTVEERAINYETGIVNSPSNSLSQSEDISNSEESMTVNYTKNQGNSYNKSAVANESTNSSVEEGSNVNITNKTEPLFKCKKSNLTEQSVVILSDKDSLIHWLEEINKTMSCAVVLFYAKWCFFSAKLAPVYNAVGRAFSGIPILAFDAYTHNSLNTRYGIVGIPTIILFQDSKPVARFNGTHKMEDLVLFIHQTTGMDYNTSVEVSPEDYLGPLPSAPNEEPNYYLVASLLFLLCVGLAGLWRLHYIQMLWGYMPSWSTVRGVISTGDREKDD